MLVRHLLEVDDPAERVFGTVAIREGYEVGEHGAQSVYRVGCVLQLTEVEPARRRHVRHRGRGPRAADAGGDAARAPTSRRAWSRCCPSRRSRCPIEVLDRARATFTAFRVAMTELQGDPYSGTLPRDPDYLAWTLSALDPAADGRAPVAARGRGRHRAAPARHPAADRGAARDQRHPVAPRHPGRPYGLVAQLTALAAMAKKARAAGGTPATVALTAAGIAFEVRSYEHDPRADVVRHRGGRGARRRPGPGVQDPAGLARRDSWSSASCR